MTLNLRLGGRVGSPRGRGSGSACIRFRARRGSQRGVYAQPSSPDHTAHRTSGKSQKRPQASSTAPRLLSISLHPHQPPRAQGGRRRTRDGQHVYDVERRADPHAVGPWTGVTMVDNYGCVHFCTGTSAAGLSRGHAVWVTVCTHHGSPGPAVCRLVFFILIGSLDTRGEPGHTNLSRTNLKTNPTHRLTSARPHAPTPERTRRHKPHHLAPPARSCRLDCDLEKEHLHVGDLLPNPQTHSGHGKP